METFTAKRTPDGNLEFDRGAKSETEGTKWKLRQSEGQNGNSPSYYYIIIAHARSTVFLTTYSTM